MKNLSFVSFWSVLPKVGGVVVFALALLLAGCLRPPEESATDGDAQFENAPAYNGILVEGKASVAIYDTAEYVLGDEELIASDYKDGFTTYYSFIWDPDGNNEKYENAVGKTDQGWFYRYGGVDGLSDGVNKNVTVIIDTDYHPYIVIPGDKEGDDPYILRCPAPPKPNEVAGFMDFPIYEHGKGFFFIRNSDGAVYHFDGHTDTFNAATDKALGLDEDAPEEEQEEA